jgi:CheY-like chemotaxis protein
MPISVAVVANDADTRARLAALIPEDAFSVTQSLPDQPLVALPALFLIALPALASPEEQLIERLRADEATAATPIIIVSALPMVQLQSVPYAADWTIAIVEEPVQPAVLAETIKFLLAPDGAA